MDAPAAPPSDLRAWVERSLGHDATVLDATLLAQGREGGPWRILVRSGGGDRALVLKAARPDEDERDRFATAAAALELVAEHELPAPRPVALDHATETAWLAMLTTEFAGSSRIGRRISDGRLRALGAAAAAIHQVVGSPGPALPVRTRTLDGYDLDAAGTPTASRPLLDRARAVLAAGPEPEDPHGFVHGDLWQGNTLWDGEVYVGAIDWDYAGFGPAGIDLGSLRVDAALFHGREAADTLLAGWSEAAGGEPANLPWWDLVAGVATPDDMGGWLPNFHAQGRTDLDLATVTQRRDDVVRNALDRLG